MGGFGRSLVGLGLGVAVGYLSVDFANDITTFVLLRDQAVSLAAEDEQICKIMGEPFTTGPWYNSTMGFTHKGHIAHSTFQLIGSQRATDIHVRAVRQKGNPFNFLYNLMGPADWRIMACDAMMPAAGGLAKPKSLLQAPVPSAQIEPNPISKADASPADA